MGINYLIDFENTNFLGIAIGIDLISSDDSIVLFYSDRCKLIRNEYIEVIKKSGARLSLVKLMKSGPDFLDKYICCVVGELHASGQKKVAIISRDKGFISVLHFYSVTNAKGFHVVRADNIEHAYLSLKSDETERIKKRCAMVNMDDISEKLRKKEVVEEKIRVALNGTPYQFKTKEVIEFFDKNREDYSNRKELYLNLLKNFGRDQGRAIYHIIKDAV